VTIDQAVERVQFAYPQIYFACHTRHARTRSTAHQLSHRDATILVHLDRRTPVRLTRLAAHLGLAASTLSEAVAHLAALGYVQKTTDARDRRVTLLALTARGAVAVRASSVLEAPRLAVVLRRMTTADRARAIAGLQAIAEACRRRR